MRASAFRIQESVAPDPTSEYTSSTFVPRDAAYAPTRSAWTSSEVFSACASEETRT